MANQQEITKALDKIKADDTLLKKFYENPSTVLEEIGLDTSDLSIKKINNESAPSESAPAPLSAEVENSISFGLSFCLSIGEVVGASVGGSGGI